MKTAESQLSGWARATRFHPATTRILTAVPICDGHDSAIITVNLELVRRGIEVVYLGYHRSARDVVRAAIQEDVRAIGLSSYNGGHVEFFTEVRERLRRAGARDVGLFGGGGGTITAADAMVMKQRGVDRIFFAGTPLVEMAEWVGKTYSDSKQRPARPGKWNGQLPDRDLARLLTAAEAGTKVSPCRDDTLCRVVGITGPGGAGKTTLIDELALRFLQARPRGRLAILSHDPALGAGGALLGDRASLVYAQDDRVFMRSLAARGRSGGLSPATRGCLSVLRATGFELVLVETTGIGQQDLPFGRNLVDQQILVLSPDYGARLQLQKIAMLEAADVVVVNKSDLPSARTATAELEQRLAMNGHGQRLIATIAKRHREPGVDALFESLEVNHPQAASHRS